MSLYPVFVGESPDASSHFDSEDEEQEEEELKQGSKSQFSQHVASCCLKFKYLAVLFTSDGKLEREMDQQFGPASTVLQDSFWTLSFEDVPSNWGRPRTRWRDYRAHLVYERLRILQEDLGCVPQ